MFASTRSVKKSRYTRSNGVSFLPCVSLQQAAYASAVAAANSQLLNNVHFSNCDKKFKRQSALSRLASKFATACSLR